MTELQTKFLEVLNLLENSSHLFEDKVRLRNITEDMTDFYHDEIRSEEC